MSCIRRVTGITFIRYAQDWKAKYLKIFGSNTINGPKQDSKNRMRISMTERG